MTTSVRYLFVGIQMSGHVNSMKANPGTAAMDAGVNGLTEESA